MNLHLVASCNLQFAQVHTKQFQWLPPYHPFLLPIMRVHFSLVIPNKHIKTFLFKTKNKNHPQQPKFPVLCCYQNEHLDVGGGRKSFMERSSFLENFQPSCCNTYLLSTESSTSTLEFWMFFSWFWVFCLLVCFWFWGVCLFLPFFFSQ